VALRKREAVAQKQLDQVQAQLSIATAELTTEQASLTHAIAALSARLVEVYKTGEPDTISVILESRGFDDLVQRDDFLQRIQISDNDLVARVRSLRNQAKATADQITVARDQVAVKRNEIDATRTQLETRTA